MVKNLTMVDVSSQTDSILLIKDSMDIIMEDIHISEIQQLVIQIRHSIISNVFKLNLTNCYQGIEVIDRSNIMVSSSMFINVGNTDVVSGGAIHLSDSNTTINNSSFSKCHAKQGG